MYWQAAHSSARSASLMTALTAGQTPRSLASVMIRSLEYCVASQVNATTKPVAKHIAYQSHLRQLISVFIVSLRWGG